jgi:hypothetical protein
LLASENVPNLILLAAGLLVVVVVAVVAAVAVVEKVASSVEEKREQEGEREPHLKRKVQRSLIVNLIYISTKMLLQSK